MPPALVSAWGITAGQQVRLRRGAAAVAAFTIVPAQGATATDQVRLSDGGRSRLGARGSFEATVSSPVPNPSRTAAEAARREHWRAVADAVAGVFE